MVIWRKQASSVWLTKNEPKLEAIAAANLAIISRPDRAGSVVEVVCGDRALADRLVRQFGGHSTSLPRDWLKSPSPHPPIRVGRRLEIVCEPTGAASKRPQLLIPAALAFGTGEHATTAMSLRLLEQTARNYSAGWRLLDAGTGTGILALAARSFGAGEAVGIDNDRHAIRTALLNARLNCVGGVRFVLGDIVRFKPAGRYEIVTANLFSELLIAALPIFRRALRQNGSLILSGILRGQLPEVVAALARAAFGCETERRRGKWVALLCKPVHFPSTAKGSKARQVNPRRSPRHSEAGVRNRADEKRPTAAPSKT